MKKFIIKWKILKEAEEEIKKIETMNLRVNGSVLDM
jgi:hypothetical protein